MVSQEVETRQKTNKQEVNSKNSDAAEEKALWDRVEKVFKTYDEDGDGLLNKKEASAFLIFWAEEELGHRPSEEMIDELFTEISTQKGWEGERMVNK